MRNYIVATAKFVGADLLDFAAPEITEVVSGRKNFETAAKSMGRQTLRKQLRSGSSKRLKAESFQQSLQNKPLGQEETFLQKFFSDHVAQFLVPTFSDSFMKSWTESPSS